MAKILFLAFQMAFWAISAQAAATTDSNISIKTVHIKSKEITRLSNRKIDKKAYLNDHEKKIDILGFIYKNYNIEDSLEDIANQKGDILSLQISNYGILKHLDRNQYHEVTHCTFIDRKTGCIIYEAEITTCIGQWLSQSRWKTDDGEIIDLFSIKKSILNRTTPAKTLLNNDNYNRCTK